MLKIKLSRVGKKRQPSYSVIVQEHSAPVKGAFLEELGFYRPAETPKVFKIKMDRVEHWLKVGAQPSDSVAALFKKEGMAGMEKYLEPRNKKRKSKKKEEASAVAAPTPAAAAPQPAAK